MSYIKVNTVCESCKLQYTYYWLYPDAKVERKPTDFQIANHNRMSDHYEAYPHCPHCEQVQIEIFSTTANPTHKER